jgi:hypothetical protein
VQSERFERQPVHLVVQLEGGSDSDALHGFPFERLPGTVCART